MRKNDTRAMVEGALLAAVSVILSLFTLYFPVLGSFTSLFLPVPIIILGLRHGVGTSILSTLVSSIVVGMISGPLQGITVLLGFGLIGISMGWALEKDMDILKTMAVGSLASLISKVILVLLAMWLMGINPLKDELVAMQETMDYILDLYGQMGVDPSTAGRLSENFSSMIDLLGLIFPALFILAAVMDTFLCYFMAKWVLGRLGQQIRGFTPFYLWRLPDFVIPGALAGVLIGLLEPYWPVKILSTLSINIITISLFAFWIQGFSLLTFFLGKYRVARGIRIILVLLVFFNPILSQLLAISGIGDIIFNFRRI